MTATNGLAPAKVNLCLHLTGLRDDGYHLLESLVVFADIGDHLTVAPSDALTLHVSGPFADGVPTDDRNLVIKAAHALRAAHGVTAGAEIHLEKHLPHGAGIGGGSSDAACALRLLATFWNVPPLPDTDALKLGADVPVCLRAPHPTFMRGIGEVLTPAPELPAAWLVLVNPGVAVPTGKVFALHDTLNDFNASGVTPLPTDLTHKTFAKWLTAQRNDMTKVACDDSIAPVIETVLETLGAYSTVSEMSGSGSTCWGWFTNQADADACAAQIAKSHPDWWVRAARILP